MFRVNVARSDYEYLCRYLQIRRKYNAWSNPLDNPNGATAGHICQLTPDFKRRGLPGNGVPDIVGNIRNTMFALKRLGFLMKIYPS